MRTALSKSLVKVRLPALRTSSSSSCMPGSKNGSRPEFHAAILRGSSSTTVNLTLGHLLAMTMAWGAPTWPAPMTQTFEHEAMGNRVGHARGSRGTQPQSCVFA